MTEAPLTTTLKAPGANAPWVVIRSDGTTQLAQQLAELQANATFADLARTQEALNAHFMVGGILGARGVDAPKDTGAFTPPAPPPAPSQEDLFAAFLAAQGQAAPAPAPAPSGIPGAPLVAGMPAKLVEGVSSRGKWQAWADPRPKEATEHMAKTEDINDPGLLNGTKKLWKWIR